MMSTISMAALAGLTAAAVGGSYALAGEGRGDWDPARPQRWDAPSQAAQGPRPGQCVGRVLLPPTFETRRRTVLESLGREVREVTPAVVEYGRRKVMVRPAHQERIATAPVYRFTYTSVAGPTIRSWVSPPARWSVRAERVLIEAGHWGWERRYGRLASGAPQPGQTVVQPTGEIMCRVWRPARYGFVDHRVQVAPGTGYWAYSKTRRTVAHRVLVRPAGVWVHDVPAQYREVEVSRTVRPERVRWVRTSRRYGEMTQQVMHKGGEGWAPVVCGGPLSDSAMRRMQSALLERGYDPGPPDGRGHPQTFDALRRFQMDHRMAAGQITVESARALGVIR